MIRRVLLTNDDGIQAIGLRCLATVLASAFEVHVVAPDRERSGVAHAFTLLNPLRCDPAPSVFPEDLVRSAHRCSGTPVDCVKIALLSILDPPPELVVSGINAGANLSLDTLYSGTAAAAREAALMGVPAIAASLVLRGRESGTREPFQTAAEIILDYIRTHQDNLQAMRDHFLNINVPGLPRARLAGFRATVLGRCRYLDSYRRLLDPAGRPYYWLEGERVVEDDRPEADLAAVHEGYVSITPMGLDGSRPDLLGQVL